MKLNFSVLTGASPIVNAAIHFAEIPIFSNQKSLESTREENENENENETEIQINQEEGWIDQLF